MRANPSAPWRARWFIALVLSMLLTSVAFGGLATGAQSTPTTAPAGTVVPTDTTTPTATAATPTASTTGTPAASPSATPAASTTGTSTPSPAAASPATTTGAAPAAASNDVDYQEIPNGGGSYNVVKVQNKTDNRLRVKAKIQLNHIPGDSVQPVNYAEAIGSCTDCQTFAVALQIDLRNPAASVVAPQNAAVAVNLKCTRCTTVADAYQYVIPVDDPTQVPDNVRNLINQMQNELQSIAGTPDITAAAAEARINAVIAQFTDLANSLAQQRDQKNDDDTPGGSVPPDVTILTPTPTAAPQGTPTATP